jgi:protein TonB
MYTSAELDAQERKNMRISGIITIVLLLLFLIFSFLKEVVRAHVPPPGELGYELVGAIDFGDLQNGSRDINNFDPSVPDPEPIEQEAESAQPIPDVAVDEAAPTPAPVVTKPEPSPVTESKPKPVPVEATPTKPSTIVKPVETEPKPSENATSTGTSEVTPTDTPSDNASSGGSNQGTNDAGTGNTGTPDIKVLDPNGLYEFGSGGQGGLEGRKPLHLPYPAYDSQEEGKLTFEFIIAPDGHVLNVKVVGLTNKASLKANGIKAIENWKFNSLPASVSQKNQTARVSILFRLKN